MPSEEVRRTRNICNVIDETGQAVVKPLDGKGNVEVNDAVAMVERDCNVTLLEIASRLAVMSEKPRISVSTVHRWEIVHLQKGTDSPVRSPIERNTVGPYIGEGSSRRTFLADLCGFNLNVWTRRHFGRSRIGERAAQHPLAHRCANINVCTSISRFGFVQVEKACNFLKDSSLPCRHSRSWLTTPASIHRQGRIEARTFSAQTSYRCLFLSPHCPFLNPIEVCFSSLKAHAKAQAYFEQE
jgi:transposase